jgi:saccharopine dehydrogenase (NAD+, L-lysine-forming)
VVPFPRSGRREVGGVRWGDLATAYRSTGIPNITTYTRIPLQGAAARPLGWAATAVLGVGPVRRIADRLVRTRVTGPDAAVRARTRSEVWGEVRDGAGGTRTASVVGPNAYALTADSVVRAVEFLGTGVGPAGPVPPGVHTPATAFGAGYLALLDGVTVSATV